MASSKTIAPLATLLWPGCQPETADRFIAIRTTCTVAALFLHCIAYLQSRGGIYPRVNSALPQHWRTGPSRWLNGCLAIRRRPPRYAITSTHESHRSGRPSTCSHDQNSKSLSPRRLITSLLSNRRWARAEFFPLSSRDRVARPPRVATPGRHGASYSTSPASCRAPSLWFLPSGSRVLIS